MVLKNHLALVLASIAIFISGCASTAQNNTGAATGAPQATALAEMPSLKVTVDCGTCTVKPTIPGLIVEGYNEAASKAGRKLSATSQATVAIREYAARGDAARFLVGAFAGKDEIKVVIAYEGKTYAVEDYYRNAWLGIDTLAKKIGEMSYAELK